MTDGQWLIDQLIQQGVDTFAIGPGSRNTPLVLAAADHPKAKTVVHTDERGAAFYALGNAKGSKKPAAVISSSGSASANLLPAVMEAYHSFTPLIVLTADRPQELRHCSANQTSDQVKLFSNLVQWQTDLAPTLDEKTIRSIAAQAVFHASGISPGPVHLNCPFREPFAIHPPQIIQGTAIPFSFPRLTAAPFRTTAKRGIIILGKVDDPAPVLALAKRLRWPVFADLLSNARCTPTEEQIRYFDYLIRTPGEPPDLIVHFGERMISKLILEWAKGVPLVHVSPIPTLQDPARRTTSRVQSDIAPFCSTFDAGSESGWLEEWQARDRELSAIIDSQFEAPFAEAHVYRSLPDDIHLYLGSSMPIRDADHFYFPKKGRGFFCNRGVSGIDGNIATAAGIADGLGSPLVAIIGDQAALHDLASFPLLKNRDVLLIISNNFGGGIFDYLPISKSDHKEAYFTASHEWSFEHAARMFGLPYVRRENELGALPRSGIVEMITDRKESHLFQKGLIEACLHAFH